MHVCKVHIDKTVDSDDLGNTFGRDRQYIICLGECFRDLQIAVHFPDLFIVDDQQGIDVILHFGNPVQSLCDPSRTFIFERDGDNTNSQDAHILRSLCNNGGGSCAGTSAHAGCYKHHPRICRQCILDLIEAFNGSLFANIGLVARTSSFGQ